MSWTAERVEACRKLWFEGHSAGYIASELGGVSRNSVIGVVYRNGWQRNKHKKRGLEGGFTQKLKEPKVRPLVTESFSTAPIIQGDHLAHVEVPIGPRVSITELNEFTCRWPIGDGANIEYCGAHPKEKKPYCPHHCGVAYEDVSARNRRISALKSWEDNPARRSGFKRKPRVNLA